MARSNPPPPDASVPPSADEPPAALTTLALTLAADAGGRRFDVALARALPQYSRSRLRMWIDAGRVTLDGRVADATRKVWGGERVTV